eukprot:COSAG02_NODE_5015_length_4723_cov_3.671064_7_plen_121_part_00
MVMRLYQERQPFYNHLEWERERLQNEKYLRNISQVTRKNTESALICVNSCVHRLIVCRQAGALLIGFVLIQFPESLPSLDADDGLAAQGSVSHVAFDVTRTQKMCASFFKGTQTHRLVSA